MHIVLSCVHTTLLLSSLGRSRLARHIDKGSKNGGRGGGRIDAAVLRGYFLSRRAWAQTRTQTGGDNSRRYDVTELAGVTLVIRGWNIDGVGKVCECVAVVTKASLYRLVFDAQTGHCGFSCRRFFEFC